MAHTDKDQRCHCPRPSRGVCPHCGVLGNAGQFARCHREALGLGAARAAERRWRFMLSEWRGTIRSDANQVKRRLRRLERRRLRRAAQIQVMSE